MKISFCFLLFFSLFLYSCAIIDFGNDEVSCSPDSSFDYYNHEYVKASFNCTVDHYSAEQCLKIQVNNQALSLLYKWDGNTLYAKPETGWVNGRCYSFSINGSVRKSNGSHFSVDNKCSFIYGDKNQSFVLTDKPADDIQFLLSDTISFTFNQEVNYVDFNKALRISPSEKIKYAFSDDNKSVTITPESGWKINTIYRWEIKDLISKDNWELSGKTEGIFAIQNDIENPSLLTICPVSDASNSSVWFENTDLDRNITKLECIGFIFSKPMDFSSIKSGISISPGISGYFYQATPDGKKFIFVPLSEYEIETKYLITVSPSVKDYIGNSLYEEKKKNFILVILF